MRCESTGHGGGAGLWCPKRLLADQSTSLGGIHPEWSPGLQIPLRQFPIIPSIQASGTAAPIQYLVVELAPSRTVLSLMLSSVHLVV
jgi:hypothetical protein